MAAEKKIIISHFNAETDVVPKARELQPEEYLKLVTEHTEGPRTGSMFSPVQYKPGHRRGNDGVVTRSAYAFDIETNKRTGEIPPPPATIARRMTEQGIAGAVVTSHRHTPEKPRYRVHVMIDTPVSLATDREVADDLATQWGIMKVLDLDGVIDAGTMDVARGFFHPRHPKGADFFSVAVKGLPMDTAMLAQARRKGEELLRQERMSVAEKPAQPPQEPQEQANEGGAGNKAAPDQDAIDIDIDDAHAARRQPSPESKVIDAFNAARSVDEMLTLHGYVAGPMCNVKGLQGRRWHAPFQTSDSWGMTVFGDFWIGMSASFQDVDIGKPTPKGFRRGDAFELFCFHEHGGNFAQAVRSAAASLGIQHDPFGGVDVEGSVASILDKAKKQDGSANGADGEMSEELEQALDEELLAAIAPEIEDVAFYGILRPIVDTCTANSEATRVGVASHLLATVSSILSPFRVDLGDDRLGLNLFFSLVGPSAKARKGTSSAPTDNHIYPAIIKALEGYADAVNTSLVAAQDQQRAIATKGKRIEAIEMRIEKIKELTPESIDARRKELEGLKDSIKPLEERITAWEAKITPAVSVRTRKDYEKGVNETKAEVADIEAEMLSIATSVLADERAIKDKATAIRELGNEIAQLKADIATEMAAIAKTKPNVAWQKMAARLFSSAPEKITGVASGEGIIYAVRDASEGGSSGEPDPGVEEKRFLIALSEMGSLLAQASRPGNMLSSVIRNVYDCVPLATTAKVSPCSCEHPFGSISGSITPQELAGLLFSTKDANANADNGFGNRFTFLYAKRNKLTPHPVKSVGLDKFGQTIGANIIKVFGALQPEGSHLSAPIGMTPAAYDLWTKLYPVVEDWEPASRNASRLYGRMSTNTRKLAAVISVINGEPEVTEGALVAAVEWMRHAANTVNSIASTLGERHQMRKAMATASWVVEKVRAAGPAGITIRDLSRNGSYTVVELRAAIDMVMKMAPCPVRVEEMSGKGGKRVTIYAV